MFAETDAIKALMLFGKMQSNSIMMATAVAIESHLLWHRQFAWIVLQRHFGVYGFGSYAMTGIAQGMAQGMQNTGEKVSSQTITGVGLLQVANIIRICHKFTTSVSTSNLTCFGIGSSQYWSKYGTQ
jgi:hypothetical protein